MHTKVKKDDVTAIVKVVRQHSHDPFVLERIERNVNGPSPTFSQSHFWYVLIGCLLTTQQRSTKGSPVNRFLSEIPFPLSIAKCRQPNTELLIKRELTEFGGIRRAPTIANQARANLEWLKNGGWTEVERHFDSLAAQRSSKPRSEHAAVERKAAHFISELSGFGPKQSRNLWQWLGLTRYEIPLDSRLTTYINLNLSMKVDVKRLGNRQYYESVLDYLQDVCREAQILPCVLDAAAFDFASIGQTVMD
jgi:hypothetical protein